MPSVNSRSMPNVWPSSTFTTPSLPTFSMASAMTSPISSSPAEMVATRAIWSLPEISLDCFLISSTTESTAFSMPRLRPSGLAPAATFLRPWGTFAWARTVAGAVAGAGLGEGGCGRRAAARDLVGRRGDLADELRALVLEDVLDLDLTSDRDTVVGDGRGAELLVEDDEAAARAERHLDGVGDGVNAQLQGLARVDVVLQFLVSHIGSLLLELGEDVGLTEDEEILAVDLDLRAAV